MSSFCYINPKNSLARDKKTHEAIDKIVCKISEIPRHTDYKLDLELLTMICVMVEHLIDNKDKKIKINKKDIVFEVYKKLFGNIRPEDLVVIDKNIQYLFENQKIKKKNIFSVVSSSICDWIYRKVLWIYNYIISQIESAILESLIKVFNIRKNIALALNIVLNLNKDAIIQYSISQLGIYKYVLFGIYFLLLA